METLDANFEVLQETHFFYIDVFVIRGHQLTISVLNFLNYLKNCWNHYGLLSMFGWVLELTLRTAQNHSFTIRLPKVGRTISLKSAVDRLTAILPRLAVSWSIADFRLVVRPTFGSRIVNERFCAVRVTFPDIFHMRFRALFMKPLWFFLFLNLIKFKFQIITVSKINFWENLEKMTLDSNSKKYSLLFVISV
jgi:hypothetical protein